MASICVYMWLLCSWYGEWWTTWSTYGLTGWLHIRGHIVISLHVGDSTGGPLTLPVCHWYLHDIRIHVVTPAKMALNSSSTAYHGYQVTCRSVDQRVCVVTFTDRPHVGFATISIVCIDAVI